MIWFITFFACQNIEKTQEEYVTEVCNYYSDCNLLESYDYATITDCQTQMIEGVQNSLTEDLDALEQCIASIQESDCEAVIENPDITISCAQVFLASQ